MSTTVEQIKSRLSIADVVSSYVKLQKAGMNFKAPCPFHSEKTPSFTVSPERGTYHCFGCGKGGDIFSFVEEMEGVDFMGALRVLAERAGVEIVFDGKRENKDEKERAYAILSDAADFFHAELVKNKEALLYLKKRGLAANTAEDFYLGFAPDSWDSLLKYLLGKKYSSEEMEKAGLVIRSKDARRGRYDRFRSRIMFPISDSAGRIVGFSGRIFGKEESTEAGAKYVNSPETILFNKSKILYGLDRAKKAIREKGFSIIVEGQMDLLLSHQIGLLNTVATSGTALTEDHLALLKRFGEKVVFGFDGDGAGLAAARRGAAMAIRIGMDTFVAEISAGKDPADFALENPEGWKASVSEADHAVSFFLRKIKERTKDRREFRLETQKEIVPMVALIESPIDRAHFVELLAKEIGVSEETIHEELRSGAKAKGAAHPRNALISPKSETGANSKSRPEFFAHEIRRLILWQKGEGNPKIDVEDILHRYSALAGSDRLAITEHLSEEEKRKLVFSAEKEYSSAIHLPSIAEEFLLRFEEALLKEERAKITDRLVDEGISEKEDVARDTDRGLEKRHIHISKRLQEIQKALSA